MLNLDLENVKLQNAVQALTPVFVRLGGSLADFVRYEELEGVKGQETKCVPFSAPTNNTRIGYELGTGCLKMSRWEELNKFCSKASNCHLLFDLNALIGRQNGTLFVHSIPPIVALQNKMHGESFEIQHGYEGPRKL